MFIEVECPKNVVIVSMAKEITGSVTSAFKMNYQETTEQSNMSLNRRDQARKGQEFMKNFQ